MDWLLAYGAVCAVALLWLTAATIRDLRRQISAADVEACKRRHPAGKGRQS